MYSVCHVLALSAGFAISVTVDLVDFTAVQNSRVVAGASLQTHQCHSSFPFPDCQRPLKIFLVIFPLGQTRHPMDKSFQ